MKNLLDIPLSTPESDLPHYAKRWKPAGCRERMEQRKAKAAAGTAMLLLTAPVWADSSSAYKMYVENPEVGQAFNAVFIGLLMLIAFNGIIGWLIGKGKG